MNKNGCCVQYLDKICRRCTGHHTVNGILSMGVLCVVIVKKQSTKGVSALDKRMGVVRLNLSTRVTGS